MTPTTQPEPPQWAMDAEKSILDRFIVGTANRDVERKELARIIAPHAPTEELVEILGAALAQFKVTQPPNIYPADHWSNRAIAALAKLKGTSV